MGCVYAIENTVTGRKYIGKTADLESRWRGHLRALLRGNHYNHELQAEWNAHGADAFQIHRLCEADGNDLLIAELQAIRAAWERDPGSLYNVVLARRWTRQAREAAPARKLLSWKHRT